MKFLIVPLYLLFGIFFYANDQHLEPCPNSPNCISTQEVRKRKKMSPLPCSGTMLSTKLRLINLLKANENAKLVEERQNYLHYEFKTNIGGFIDDVEFLIDTLNQAVHFRSASRIGYGDFGKNRRRMTQFTSLWLQTYFKP